MPQFYINPGELRTKIRIQYKKAVGTGSFATTTWVDLGSTDDTAPPKHTMAKWEAKIKGTLTTLSDSTQMIDSGTATIRYNAAVTSQCRIVKDGIIYELLAPPVDPTQHKQWLLLEVKAAMSGG